MRQKIVIGIVLLVLIGGSIAAWKYVEKTGDLVAKEPAARLTATELIAAFDQDTAAASKRYLHKVIAVTGTVVKKDSSAVELGESGSMSVVVAGIDERHLSDIDLIKEGEVITLQGECTGFDKGSGDDLLAALGTTVQLKAAGVKK